VEKSTRRSTEGNAREKKRMDYRIEQREVFLYTYIAMGRAEDAGVSMISS